MRLGWRWTRPNDFSSADQRPLRDTFGSLQRHLTIPHFRLERAADESVGATSVYIVTWDTTIDDPWDLWRSGTGVQVPREFDSWWFVGTANCVWSPLTATGRRVLGIYVDGTIDAAASAPTSTANSRLNVSTQKPINKGSTLTVRYTNDSANGDALTHVWFAGMFYPRF